MWKNLSNLQMFLGNLLWCRYIEPWTPLIPNETNWLPLTPTDPNRAALSSTDPHWVPMTPTNPKWPLLNPVDPHVAPLSSANLHWALLLPRWAPLINDYTCSAKMTPAWPQIVLNNRTLPPKFTKFCKTVITKRSYGWLLVQIITSSGFGIAIPSVETPFGVCKLKEILILAIFFSSQNLL